mmetsp:Transcript_13561/g.43381  ORF Transcript_13561/g.43381 Transcript_13561/m.43381 type:complete len:305 (+) Transcript_13561:467-1381(+)
MVSSSCVVQRERPCAAPVMRVDGTSAGTSMPAVGLCNTTAVAVGPSPRASAGSSGGGGIVGGTGAAAGCSALTSTMVPAADAAADCWRWCHRFRTASGVRCSSFWAMRDHCVPSARMAARIFASSSGVHAILRRFGCRPSRDAIAASFGPAPRTNSPADVGWRLSLRRRATPAPLSPCQRAGCSGRLSCFPRAAASAASACLRSSSRRSVASCSVDIGGVEERGRLLLARPHSTLSPGPSSASPSTQPATPPPPPPPLQQRAARAGERPRLQPPSPPPPPRSPLPRGRPPARATPRARSSSLPR